ncbi:MAG: FAD-binding oxidoreductase [Deltaproteobacteria bacterium]|nr:FAD-binding oxidoreductase [Deltaproteobacteria bacterium]
MVIDALRHIPSRGEILFRGDARLTPYNHDTMLTGDPDALVRPRDIQECREILAYCHAHRLPVTFCAGHTAMTGSSVAQSGLLLSIEHLTGIRDIGLHNGRPQATAAPGVFLGDFQRAVASEGFFYPPSPTSRNEAMLGATIATNATGDNTYKYGTTRRYVRAMRVIMADGTQRLLERPADQQISELKNTAGYFLLGTPIDHFIGSEGTLGLIVEVTVDLLPQPQPHFGLLIFCPSNDVALSIIGEAHRDAAVSPSALEYIDQAALQIMATHPTFPSPPAAAQAAVLCYQEYAEEMRDPFMEAWFALLERAAPEMHALLDATIVAEHPADEERLRTWRHHIPAHVNEIGHRLEGDDGGKVGSDWWVPIGQMPAMMAYMYHLSDAIHVPYLAFGHLGNGHPHVNYLARNAKERQMAIQAVDDCCRKAVALGGGVAGEHGLGKLKRDLLAIQHPTPVIDTMRALKQQYDPHWILGRGNILVPPE